MGSRRYRASATVVRPVAECGGVAGGAVVRRRRAVCHASFVGIGVANGPMCLDVHTRLFEHALIRLKGKVWRVVHWRPRSVLPARTGLSKAAAREAGRRVRGHRRGTCQRRGGLDCGIRGLRHRKQAGANRTLHENRRGSFDIGVDIADIQGQEHAAGCRQCRSRA